MGSNQSKLYLCLLLCSGVLLSGCQYAQNSSGQTSNSAVPPSAAARSNLTAEQAASVDTKNSKIGICQSELASLKRINPKAYEAKQAYFNELVNNAAIYGAVRADVNEGTKDTLDALYRYKTNQLCSEIEREVLQSLIERGEGVK
ncbi:hypothetical protein [Serratia microhaemolytica]|uniref:hypothetical protein n=1 Tax=Serratia microhaemolytica TaxID=2675110 RepID=UPI000FDF31AC|nr:hypothetical protein [Serratia microhaemolytica]